MEAELWVEKGPEAAPGDVLRGSAPAACSFNDAQGLKSLTLNFLGTGYQAGNYKSRR